MTTWAPSASRDREIAALRHVIEDPNGQADVHVDGFSGLGKTRLVMEALRGRPYEPLVVYVSAADQFQSFRLNDLQAQARTAVIVVDECDAKSHDVYASALSVDTRLRLITIGEPCGRSTRSPMIFVRGLEDDSIRELLRANHPGLWPEAIRVITDVAAGNVDYALKASRVVVEQQATGARQLVTAGDVQAFIARELPDGALFLGCCALALFSRIGFDGDVSRELASIADGLELDVTDLRAAAVALDRRGLLTRQGRYRSVGPHPIALYLAGRGWSEFQDQIVRTLLPTLGPELAERLLRRATELGQPEAVRNAVGQLLGPGGPLGSWAALSDSGNGQLLTHAAVLAPGATIAHLARLMRDASDEQLLQMRALRRSLVWTLEKLAWHPDTFFAASDLLLRLAVNENEDFSNNASGTWVDLFGTMLPGTAADPDSRMSCLIQASRSDEQAVRLLAVRAAERALDTHETITVSGELQGGTVVPPRGTPPTYGDAWSYRNAAIDVLRALADDHEASVATAAFKALLGSIHGSLEIDANRERLTTAFASLDAQRLRLVRTEIANLDALFERADVSDNRVPGVRELAAALPPATDLDRLWSLGHTHSWDRVDGSLVNELLDVATRLGADAPQALVGMLDEPGLPAAHEIGRVLAALAGGTSTYLGDVAGQLSGSRMEALVGYLWALVDGGQGGAFDTFIDGRELEPLVSLELTVRGPVSSSASERVARLVPAVSVRDGAVHLFRWVRDSDQRDLAVLVEGWSARLETQADYNAVVDLVALYLHGRELSDDALRAVVEDLVAERRRFPDVGQQGWDWTQLARHQLESAPEQLVDLLIELIEADAISVYEGSEEMKLFRRAITASDASAWVAVMERQEAGAWRLSFALRGWFAAVVDTEVARGWVGGDSGRARQLASAAPVGGNELPGVTLYLIEEFGEDDEVAAALVGQFISGTWMGPESDRIRSQIETVEGWIAKARQSPRVLTWASRLLGYLKERLQLAEQREAEDRF